MRTPRLTRLEIATILLGLLYIVSPVDFVPEIVAGPLGLADDTAALALIAATVTRAMRRPHVVTVPSPTAEDDRVSTNA